jgi:para-aminobenzoate synthetase / 4-amino-4-deoxychorismate lyase
LIGRDEVLLKSNNEWLHYTQPHLIVSVDDIRDLREALAEVERLVNSNNWHAAGFVSFEAAPAFDRAFHSFDPDDFPLLWFGLYSHPHAIKLPSPKNNLGELNWRPTIGSESYNTAIEKIKDFIARGMTYQVNYTMRLKSDFYKEEWDFFLQLVSSQNKHAAYIDTGRYVICSASPELFFELDGETIRSRPMKGTVRRGRTTHEDNQKSNWLYNSMKNRAENVMIVDMIRNDLGRIAEIGSVHVPELFTIEKYPTLLQMTSTVEAKTISSLTDIFGALFPCASITGAPKISTMDIISKLETTPRNIYTGSIGYIAPNRHARFNVAIRTALIDRKSRTAEYGIGGGIVWDSTSTDEYSEALLKACVLMDHPKEFFLLETMLWTPADGYFLQEKHIDRMADSAEYFDFLFSRGRFLSHLKKLSIDFDTPQRVRVVLDRSGDITTEAKAFKKKEGIFNVRLAEKPIDSNDPFVFHKTTRREMYPLIEQDDVDDILLYNEKGELTEFTTGNLVVEMDHELFTPPTSCGLLAGTFRAHLLEAGKIKERVIQKEELPKCSAIFLVNSVRKWIPVVFI